MVLTDLEQQQANLAAVQLDDFRSANLFDLVAEQIPEGSRVLDVGCGAGGLVGYLLERQVDIWGVDTSEATVRAAQGFLDGRGLEAQRIRVGTTSDLIADGELADVVVCMDCLSTLKTTKRCSTSSSNSSNPEVLWWSQCLPSWPCMASEMSESGISDAMSAMRLPTWRPVRPSTSISSDCRIFSTLAQHF